MKVVLKEMIDPLNYNSIAKEAENNLFELKKNVQRLIKEYTDAVNENDKLKLQLAKIRAQIDDMGKE